MEAANLEVKRLRAGPAKWPWRLRRRTRRGDLELAVAILVLQGQARRNDGEDGDSGEDSGWYAQLAQGEGHGEVDAADDGS